MSREAPNWDDLKTRLTTGAGLVAVGVAGMVAGGPWFAGLAALVTGIMVWELSRMVAPDRRAEAVQLGVLTGVAVLLARALPPAYVVPVLCAPPLVGVALLSDRRKRDKLLFAAYALGISLAGYGLTSFRDEHGVVWLFWLVLVVVATDIAGYFGGRQFGGRKFWPRVSPKKTWSGVLCGWAAAAVVGALFLTFTNAGRDLVWISVVLSFASQMGDIAESMVKRRMGVKDSSALLPGHGGLFDRFDALLGAALLMLFVAQVIDVPEVAF